VQCLALAPAVLSLVSQLHPPPHSHHIGHGIVHATSPPPLMLLLAMLSLTTAMLR